MVKVTVLRPMCHEFEPITTEYSPYREMMYDKSVASASVPRWCDVEVRRGRCQLRSHPRPLTMVQNYKVRSQKSSSD
ncbi:hypothetical protein TNCV_2388791 [Trichonephila clavipes]|nr:hypothetical protein TNCV_2388791 [Trichonephila clavipes]